MIKYKSTLLAFLATIMLFACGEKDPCEGISCQNGGTCFEGKCQCPDGFEGTNCETAKLPKTVNVTSIKITKFPAKKQNGSDWDDDGTNPDIYPGLMSLKADKTIDESLWISDLVKLNATIGQEHNFSIILPKLSLTNYDKGLAFFLFDKDGSSLETMAGISFFLKDVVVNKPSVISITCPTCIVGFDLTVTYE